MRVYLAKFNNKPILDDFEKELKKAKEKSIRNNRLYFYEWYLNEMYVVGCFLGIRENIADKLGEQLYEIFENSEVIPEYEKNDT